MQKNIYNNKIKMEILEKKLKLDKEKLQLEWMKEEERIMQMNTSGMPPHL